MNNDATTQASDAEPNCSAVILAGGTGQRFGGEIPKQLQTLGGVPILFHSLSRIAQHSAIREVVIVGAKSWLTEVEHVANWALRGKDWKIVAGGTTRNHSVRNGLDAAAATDGLVAVHDGVRPLVSEDLITRTLLAAEAGHASLPVISTIDMIVELEGDSVKAIPDRSRLRRGQSPQVFRLPELRQAFLELGDRALTFTTLYEVLLAYQPNSRIVAVRGDERNIKITVPVDQSVAGHFLVEGDRRGPTTPQRHDA